MRTYINPHHTQNLYLEIQASDIADIRDNNIFEKLYSECNKPLQVMCSSRDTVLVRFLEAHGCKLLRKCFEAEFSKTDWHQKMSGKGQSNLLKMIDAVSNPKQYKQACDLVFQKYCRNHAQINPWTDTAEAFAQTLPKAVYYAGDWVIDDVNLAFVEEGEIAYAASSMKNHDAFTNFAQSLLSLLFSEFDTVLFEADDNDWEHQILLEQFDQASAETLEPAETWNTYVYSHPEHPTASLASL